MNISDNDILLRSVEILLLYAFLIVLLIFWAIGFRHVEQEIKNCPEVIDAESEFATLLESVKAGKNSLEEIDRWIVRRANGWFMSLDNLVGTAFFAAGIGVAGTPQPLLFGLIALVFVFASMKRFNASV
jgi:hypothetical protein